MEFYLEAMGLKRSRTAVLSTECFMLNLPHIKKKTHLSGCIHIGNLAPSRFNNKDFSCVKSSSESLTVTGHVNIKLNEKIKVIGLERMFDEKELLGIVANYRSMLLSYPSLGDYGNTFQAPSRMCYALYFQQDVISSNLGVISVLHKYDYRQKVGYAEAWETTLTQESIRERMKTQINYFENIIRKV
jgi:hypothetical protein